MRVNTITLNNFRNYSDLYIELAQGLNLFIGENAQGKTNLLEAVFLCALGRSHRTRSDGDMIRASYDTARIKLDFTDRLGSRRIEIELRRQVKKRVRVDSKLLARSADQMGVLNAVIFSPEDLSLIKDGPSERRRFMDMELSQMRPLYCYALQAYTRALKQRNALLKLGGGWDEHLAVWEAQMAEAASVIAPLRTMFAKRLNEIAGELHSRVCRGREELTVGYEACVKGHAEKAPESADEYAREFEDELRKRRGVDFRRGMTTFGIHREDLSIEIDGVSARLFASQGQQRTGALSLKLSEIALVEELTQCKPVVLLDDVLSELDEHRRVLLFGATEGSQTIVTATGAEGYAPRADRMYVVKAGRVELS